MIVELGRLTFDVKLETVGKDNSKKVLNNRIAIYQGKDGQGNVKTTFIDIVAWGPTAEYIASKYKKGFEILVEGQIINKTKKKDNIEYESVCLLVNEVKQTFGNPKEYEDVPDFLKSR